MHLETVEIKLESLQRYLGWGKLHKGVEPNFGNIADTSYMAEFVAFHKARGNYFGGSSQLSGSHSHPCLPGESHGHNQPTCLCTHHIQQLGSPICCLCALQAPPWASTSLDKSFHNPRPSPLSQGKLLHPAIEPWAMHGNCSFLFLWKYGSSQWMEARWVALHVIGKWCMESKHQTHGVGHPM